MAEKLYQVRLTERQLWLLKNIYGNEVSHFDEDSEEKVVADVLSAAWARAYRGDHPGAGSTKRTVKR